MALAPATTGPITGYGGLCMDVRGASAANFTPVQVYTCNGTNRSSGPPPPGTPSRRLDVNAGGTANGTTVDLYDCNSTGAQSWALPQLAATMITVSMGRYVSRIDRDHEKWSASAAWAAFWPHMPCTPPPGGVELEHRYTPGIAVRYGFHRGVGRSTVCSRVPAPPLMSPPT